MKKQIFEYQWGIPQDGCHYISEGDLYHAICNSDRFPFSLMKKPETPEEKVMQETLDAVVAAINAVPKHKLRYQMLVNPEQANKRLGEVYKGKTTDICLQPLGMMNFIDDMARRVSVIEPVNTASSHPYKLVGVTL